MQHVRHNVEWIPHAYPMRLIVNGMMMVLLRPVLHKKQFRTQGNTDMKLLLIKCMICSAWFGGQRNHCPHCAASKIPVGSGYIHLNALTGKVIASAVRRYNFHNQALAIAQE